ncbi:hypothetical protein NXH76_29230 [Blautia schinkii]|nr:hypothetical protein [Blautia schinkii]
MSERRQKRRPGRRVSGVRRALLVTEVLVIALVLIGGSRLSRSALAQGEAVEDFPQVIDAQEQTDAPPTPEFSWKNYQVIAHALGGLEGKAYLNSKESFINYYEKGVRLFEVDLAKTEDGVWVCRHSWNNSLGQWEGEGKQVMTAENFLSTPLYGKFTPMTFKELLLLLKDYPDAFVLLDSKQYSVRNYRRTLEDYSEYLEIARMVDAEHVLGQLIPEIYNEAMFPGTAQMYRFPSYIYSLWQEYSAKELKQIAVFCREKGIPAVTVSDKYWSEKVQKIFDDKGILVYIYTVNDQGKAKEYLKKGAAGVCTDVLLDKDLA